MQVSSGGRRKADWAFDGDRSSMETLVDRTLPESWVTIDVSVTIVAILELHLAFLSEFRRLGT